MAKALSRTALLLEAARLHYEKHLTRSDVAKQIGVNKMQVTRLLQEAAERGIVQITVQAPRLESLELKLKEKFGFLRDVRVIQSSPTYAATRDNWGVAAARYFDENVRAGNRVALSGGFTFFSMAQHIKSTHRPVHFFPAAMIGRGPTIFHLDPAVILLTLWHRSGQRMGDRGGVHYATVLPYEENILHRKPIQPYRPFLKSSAVREIYKAMQRLDFAFVGVGPLSSDAEYLSNTFDSTYTLLKHMGVADSDLRDSTGDLGYNFIDRDGETRRDWDFFLTVRLDTLEKMVRDEKRVVLVAGWKKEETIAAALRRRRPAVNAVVTDDRAAEALLDMSF